LALLDRVAQLTTAGNESFAEMQAVYQAETELGVPPVIRSYLDTGVKMIEIRKD
jgi:hypothetical protein